MRPILPAPESPVAAVARLRAAYEHLLIGPFARLLTADFRFIFGDPALRERFPAGLSREEEIASASGLFHAVSSGPQPPHAGAPRIEVTMDTLITLNDPEHPDDPARRQWVIAPRVLLRIRMSSGVWIEAEVARHEFHVVRGDVASLPAASAADADHWYVREWIEVSDIADTVSPPPMIAQGIAKASALAGASDGVQSGAGNSLRGAAPIALAILSHANPARGPVALELSLPGGAAARLDVVDVAGRIRTRREVRDFTPGRHRVDLAAERLPPGVYWLRLTQGRREVVSKLVVVR